MLMERMRFCTFVRAVPHGGAVEKGCLYHCLNLGFVCSLLQCILELGLGGNIGSIVLVDLFARGSARSFTTRHVLCTMLYELSKDDAIIAVWQIPALLVK
jgi:hypothetical protein